MTEHDQESLRKTLYIFSCLYDKFISFIIPSVFNLLLFIFFFSNSIFLVREFPKSDTLLEINEIAFNIPKLCKIRLIASLLNLNVHFPTAVFIKLIVFCREYSRI